VSGNFGLDRRTPLRAYSTADGAILWDFDIVGPEHPLALFLDDLQWLDASTLDLLEDHSS
jgi:hypothetical protein